MFVSIYNIYPAKPNRYLLAKPKHKITPRSKPPCSLAAGWQQNEYYPLVEEISLRSLSPYWKTSKRSKNVFSLQTSCSTAVKFLRAWKTLFYTPPKSSHPPKRCPDMYGRLTQTTSLNAINVFLIEEKLIPDPAIFLTRSLGCSTRLTKGWIRKGWYSWGGIASPDRYFMAKRTSLLIRRSVRLVALVPYHINRYPPLPTVIGPAHTCVTPKPYNLPPLFLRSRDPLELREKSDPDCNSPSLTLTNKGIQIIGHDADVAPAAADRR